MLLFFLSLLANYRLLGLGWDRPLLGMHDFRQTQTAISTRSLLRGSPLLEYETPVLGKPWAIPIEFPLYQAIVAAVVRVTGMPLDQAGRLVSVIAFYAMLPFLHSLLAHVQRDRALRLVPLSLLLASPLYIFWSRAFLIESLALLLSISFLWLAARAVTKRRADLAGAAALLGVLAALTKVTTFVVASVPLAAWLVAGIVRAARQRRPGDGLAAGVFGAVLVIPSLLATAVWVRYSDSVKRLNPLAADFLTHEALREWIYGTFEERFSPAVWYAMLHRSIPEIAGELRLIDSVSFLVAAGCVPFVMRTRYRQASAICLLAFLSGPFVFTHLYRVHNYYFYASGVYLLIFGSFGLFSLLESGNAKVRDATCFLVLPLLLFSMFRSHLDFFGPLQVEPPLWKLPVAAKLRSVTRPDDVIVIYGQDWNPAVPYYADRRALMDRWEMPLGDPRFRAAMRALRGERIGAVVVSGTTRLRRDFVRERLEFFGCGAQPVYSDRFTDIYVPRGGS
ncbi:MAG TPA: glycosyltransferase family 39 protein [Thermoanaerobaculia bacterium]|nr:glycosyltransferase family 39 protein [Thermoanaerobaculia bacterium]